MAFSVDNQTRLAARLQLAYPSAIRRISRWMRVGFRGSLLQVSRKALWLHPKAFQLKTTEGLRLFGCFVREELMTNKPVELLDAMFMISLYINSILYIM